MSLDLSEKLESEFVDLVKQSWKVHQLYSWNNAVDEILIGAVITTNLEKGYNLIDIKSVDPFYSAAATPSSGAETPSPGYKQPINSHFLRFENSADASRLIYNLERITQNLVETKVMGQLCNITVGYGEKSANFGKMLETLKQELKSTFIDTSEPGIVTFDADMSSGYIYAQVSIILNIADYNKDNQVTNIDYDKLNGHIEAIVHSLKKYLKGRNDS